MKVFVARRRGLLVLLCAVFGAGSLIARQARPDQPETVMITFHAKSGAGPELAAVIASHWATARRMKLVTDDPHLTLRSADGQDFVEILTWRDAATPDSAPPQIQRIWGEMNRLVEPRGGRPGLIIDPMSVVTETAAR